MCAVTESWLCMVCLPMTSNSSKASILIKLKMMKEQGQHCRGKRYFDLELWNNFLNFISLTSCHLTELCKLLYFFLIAYRFQLSLCI
ncbi:putative Suppressor of sable [Daphnia magna]|uniref:Putative Suppressor of sable n=1 Tax=Daphnia magna TaxID=35525 RepID=A0A164TLE4_9CRUS|nr:putative Suppressor of sable [Daphnia magna]